MKYSILISALLAVTLTACQDEERGKTVASPTPDQLTPVPPAEPAPAPQAAAPAAAPADVAPAAEATAPAVDGAAAPATGETAAPAPETATTAAAETATPEAAAPAVPAASGGAVNMEAGMALAKSSGCFACHNIEQKRVGPAWNDVSTKYKGDAGAKANLVSWVHKGTAGDGKGPGSRWGFGVMPAYSPRVSDADIDTLVDFILSLKK